MRPEVQVLPGPPPALTSGNASQGVWSSLRGGGCRIKNSYLVTVPRHEPDGHDASLFSSPFSRSSGSCSTIAAGSPSRWSVTCPASTSWTPVCAPSSPVWQPPSSRLARYPPGALWRPAAGSPDPLADCRCPLPVRAAMANLARANPSLGWHLASTIRMGRSCSYTPDPRGPIAGSADPGPSAPGLNNGAPSVERYPAGEDPRKEAGRAISTAQPSGETAYAERSNPGRPSGP